MTILSNATEIPEVLKPWLMSSESLTKELKARMSDASVNLIGQVWQQSNWWDKYLLNLEYQACFVREIIMCCGDTQCWYARTLIPEKTFEKKPNLFNNLGNQSLGCHLFRDRDFKRQQLAYYPVSDVDIEYCWAMAYSSHSMAKQLWVRRATYLIEDQPLFLLEVFLPAFSKLLCEK